jgi:hypothetical protein
MPIMHIAFLMLAVLAIAIAGTLTVLDEILSDTPHSEPVPTTTEPKPQGGLESENSKRRSGGECRT